MNERVRSEEKDPQRRWPRPVLLGGVFLAALVALGSWTALASGRFGPGGLHGGPHARDFLQFRVNRVLDEVEVSDEQREQIEAIVEEVADEVSAAHAEGHPFEGLKAALTGPTIDREAIEALRVQKIQRMDASSRRVVDALASVAEILTPVQREKLATLMDKHGSDHRGRRAHDRHGPHDRG